MIRIRLLVGALLALTAGVGVAVVPGPGPVPVSAATPASVTCDPVAATEPAGESALVGYEPMLAERIVDTRDGTGGVGAELDAGCTLVLDTTGLGPVDATSFALSVTVISPVKGFFTAFPCASGRPGTSSVNARPGFPTPNLVVATPDSAGEVCLYSNRGGHVVMDLSGWWTQGDTDQNRFTPIDPVRADDTREQTPPTKLAGRAIRAVEVGGTLVPDDAVAVTVNLAAVAPDTRGFLVVYPCGVPAPLASNLNARAGERRAVSAIVELGVGGDAEGKICVTGNATTHYILDVTGYYAPSSPTSPDLVLSPQPDTRVVDTRTSALPGVRFEAGVPQTFDLGAAVDRADDMVGAVLNVVAVQADRSAFASVYPCQSPPPSTSSLNYDLDQTSNLVVTAVNDDGEICLRTNSSVEIVVDLVGVFTGPPGSLVNQLSLTDSGGALLSLEQDFDVDGVNSTLRCDGGADVGLRLGLAPGVSAEVDGVAVPPRDPVEPDREVAIPDEGLMTLSLARGSESVEYYIRCLPDDFSALTVTRTGETAPGWYLTELGWGSNTTGRFVVIMDERGVPVWFKRAGTERRLINSQLLETGDLAITQITGAGFGIPTGTPGDPNDPPIGHRIHDLDGNLVDEWQSDQPFVFPIDHHDLNEIPTADGGGYTILSYPLVAPYDLTGPNPEDVLTLPPISGLGDCDPAVVSATGAIVDSVVRELDDSGALLWEWSALDSFDLGDVTFAQCFGNYVGATPSYDEIDVFHINSLQRVEDGSGDYVASARHLDAVFRLDRSVDTGVTPDAVSWVLAPEGSTHPKRLTILGDALGGVRRSHDARMDGDLLTVYDNRTATGGPSRAVAYRIDEVAMTATLEWQIFHPEGLTSNQIGSARVTPDGSVLVGWGATQPMFVEYSSPDSGLVELQRIEISPNEGAYRIVKYAPDVFDAAELRAAAGGTLEQP